MISHPSPQKIQQHHHKQEERHQDHTSVLEQPFGCLQAAVSKALALHEHKERGATHVFLYDDVAG